MSLYTGMGLIGLLILIEGFFSGSEIALVSADRMKLRSQADAGSRGARLALKMLERPAHLLGTCLVGTNLSTVSAATVAAALLAPRLGEQGDLWTVAILSMLILLFGELIPKSVYQHHADRMAPVVVIPLRAFSVLLTPALVLIEAGTRALFRLLGTSATMERTVSREDIQLLLGTGDEVRLDEGDRAIIQRVFDFSETTVDEVMIPLIEVVAVDETAPASEAVRRMVDHGFSRLPTFHERVDRITGFVQHDDLLFLSAEELAHPVSSLARPLAFVPESRKVDGLLLDLRRQRSHVAVVVNEYGGAVGLVSREDLLEELVGEILDESDRAAPHVRKLSDRQWLVSARVEEDGLEDATGFVLPEGDYETLAGFLLLRLGHVPAIGEQISEAGWLLEVTRVSDRAILEVKMTRGGRKKPRR